MRAGTRLGLLVGIAAFFLAVIGVLSLAVRAEGSAPRTEYLPCGQEDSNNCVWDARHRGNGMGQSYFVGEGGKVYPLPHHVAHFLVYRK